MKAFRSALFVPGNRVRMLTRAEQTSADVIVPDMEDSVPDSEKAAARETVAAQLPQLRASGRLVMPRINSLATGFAAADLAAVVGPDIDGISVGKINAPRDISEISLHLSRLEQARHLPVGSIRLLPWIETAQAIVHCHAICGASKRIVGVAFGGEDFTNDMQIERLADETQLLYARSAMCIAARAAGVLAFDTPYFQFRDAAGHARDCARSRQLGFKGRFAIHPDQTDTINAAYGPTAAEIAQARAILAAAAAAEKEGRGSTSLDGQVIDVPVVKRARGLLEQAGLAD